MPKLTEAQRDEYRRIANNSSNSAVTTTAGVRKKFLVTIKIIQELKAQIHKMRMDFTAAKYKLPKDLIEEQLLETIEIKREQEQMLRELIPLVKEIGAWKDGDNQKLKGILPPKLC